MADMSYQEQLANVSELSPEDLTKLEQDVIAAFAAAEDEDDLDAMSAAADALDQVRNAKATVANGELTEDAEVGTETASGGPDADAMAVAASAEKPKSGAKAKTKTKTDDDEVAESEDDEPVVPSGSEPATDVQVEPAAAGEGQPGPTITETEAAREADGLTAGGLPAALKDHQFKKKNDPVDDEDDEVAEAASKKKKFRAAVTAAAASRQQNIPEEIEVAVEQDDIPEDRQPIVASSTTTIVAGADIPQRAAGSEFGSFMEVNESFVARLNTLRNSRGSDGDQVIVASVQSEIDSERELFPGDDASNYAKVEGVIRQMRNVDREALVASGGYCAPLETRYDIFGVGVMDRPVRDSLAGFQATRGGIRYVAPPVLSSFSGAVGLWTAQNDATPGTPGPATKPVMIVACQNEITVVTDAVTLQLQFGNLMTRAYPELVARNNELGLIYHARFAEQNLLNKISALSTAVSSAYSLGTARDFLNALGRAAAAYRARHRLNVNTPLRVLAPAWVLDAMREDLSRGYPGNDIEWPDAQINMALAARNINITWHLDDPTFTGVQNAGALNDFPATIKWWIFAEGTFLFLDGGTLDLGIVRDSTLVGTNDYRMFVETFEGVAKVGIESIQVTTTTHVTGAIVGTVTPS